MFVANYVLFNWKLWTPPLLNDCSHMQLVSAVGDCFCANIIWSMPSPTSCLILYLFNGESGVIGCTTHYYSWKANLSMDTATLHLLIVNSSALQDIHLFMYNAILSLCIGLVYLSKWSHVSFQSMFSLSLSLICFRAYMDTCRHNHIL